MKRQYDAEFIKKLKRLDTRIHKSWISKILIFAKNPYDSELNNHELQNEYKGYRSIDVTADYRAIYEELNETGEIIAYFFRIGTHKELYIKEKKMKREIN